MKSLVHEKELAIKLRKKGHTYREILKEVNVSKSTISLWLKEEPLTELEKKYLKSAQEHAKSRGRIRAAAALRQRRLERDETIRREALIEFQKYSPLPFFHVGIALYWAEGAKRSNSFGFTNSDEEMLKLMIHWMQTFLDLSREQVTARLFIHKPFVDEHNEEYWAQILDVPLTKFAKTILKPSGLLVKKRANYRGCVRLELGKTKYIRKMTYWQEMLVRHHRNEG